MANERNESPSLMILEYIKKRPGCGDTFEGIVRWWLETVRIELAIKEVSVAIDELTEKGVLKRVELADGTVIYKFNKDAGE